MMTGPTWLDIAHDEMVREVFEKPGLEANERILRYHQTTTLRAASDEVPWCASFVNWCVEHSGLNGTDSAMARSWLTWGSGINPNHPPFGAITILKRSWPDQPGPETLDAPGHVGFFVGQAGRGRILLLGGNQTDAVAIDAYDVSRILGYRWPGAHRHLVE